MGKPLVPLEPEKQAVYDQFMQVILKRYASTTGIGATARKMLFAYDIEELKTVDDNTIYDHLQELQLVVPGACISKTRGKIRSQIRICLDWIREVYV